MFALAGRQAASPLLCGRSRAAAARALPSRGYGAASADGGGHAAEACPLQEAFAQRVAEGRLEDSALQRRVVQFMSSALAQTRASASGGGRPKDWVWPRRASGSAKAALEDRQSVAAYTARMAAENAARVRQQRGGPAQAAVAKPTADAQQSQRQPAEAAPARPDPQELKRRRAQSVYLHGPVGTGKTMMLDLLFERARAEGLRVRRQHFYEFMLGLHLQIHNIERERPVETAANMLADEVDMLCFDEFQITDVQDASILPRFFEVLFVRGVAIAVTSNTAPQLLYSGGLNRHLHVPAFINVLSDYCTVLGLGSQAVDYRRKAADAEADAEAAGGDARATYLCGGDRAHLLEAQWLRLRGDAAVSPRDLALPMGRSFRVERAAGTACWLSFQEVCGAERGEADFLALASSFGVVLLQDVPVFSSFEEIDALRRFVKLLDVLYDRRVRIVLSAAAPLDELFVGIREEGRAGGMDDLAWRTALYSADGKVGMTPGAVGTLCEAIRATERAESRLREMRTLRYWDGCASAWAGGDSA